MNKSENKKDDLRTCHTFDEKEGSIQIKLFTEDTSNQEAKFIEDLSDKINIHIFKNNSMFFLDYQQQAKVPSIYYCFSDPPILTVQQKNSLQIDQRDKINYIQHLYSKVDNKYELDDFNQYFGNVAINSQLNEHLFYGKTSDEKLIFLLIEFKHQNNQNEQRQPGDVQIQKLQVKRILNPINKKDNPIKIVFDSYYNFALMLYENGMLSLIQPAQNNTGKRQLFAQQWRETQLCKKQIDDIRLINQKKYKGDLLWKSKTAMFIQKDIDFFNLRSLDLEQQEFVVGGHIQFFEISDDFNDIFFIEKKLEKDKTFYYLCKKNFSEKINSQQIRLEGPCLQMKRNGRHAFVVIEKTLKNQPQSDSIQILKVYDMQNKYLAYNFKKFNLSIYDFDFHSQGILMIINSQKQKKQIINIEEDSDQEKFEKFRKRRFFELAANFAENKNNLILKYQIYKEAGDYYFSDGQYEQSVQFYIKTIGALENKNNQDSDEFQPSFIIKNFLKSTLLQYITKYLEALHENKNDLANLYDTSLLISIYLKQEKEQEVEDFFKNYKKTKEKINKAIDLCLESQKFELAKRIAQQQKLNEKYLEISIENNFFGEPNSEQAKTEAKNILEYLQKLQYDEFQDSIKQNGYILYPHQPQFTFEIIVSKIQENLKKYENIFCIESYLNIFQNFEEVYQFFQTELFVDYLFKNLNQFDKGKKQAATFIINYLVFCYLKNINSNQKDEQANNKTIDEREKLHKKIIDFINSNETRIVNESYLILLFSEPGLLEYKQKIMYKNGKKIDLVNLYFSNKEYDKCSEYCSANKDDADLPVHFLKLICEMDQTLEEIESEKSPNKFIPKLLDQIEQNKQYGPLFLMKFFKKNKYLKIKDIKEYYKKLLRKYQERISNLRLDQQQNNVQLTSKKEKLLDLKTNPRYFQFTICQFCKENINQATIYFFCGHFYHRNCIEKTQCQECDMIQRDKIEQRQQFLQEKIQVEDIHPFNYENCIDVFGKASF